MDGKGNQKLHTTPVCQPDVPGRGKKVSKNSGVLRELVSEVCFELEAEISRKLVPRATTHPVSATRSVNTLCPTPRHLGKIDTSPGKMCNLYWSRPHLTVSRSTRRYTHLHMCARWVVLTLIMPRIKTPYNNTLGSTLDAQRRAYTRTMHR